MATHVSRIKERHLKTYSFRLVALWGRFFHALYKIALPRMDPFSNADDFYSLAEEQFDFDVSLSPDWGSREDGEGEDEVFAGPVTDEGKSICAGVGRLAMDSASSGPSSVAEEEQRWSPCSGEDFDRVSSEAQKLATRLLMDHQAGGTLPAENQGRKQDAGSKLDKSSKPSNRTLCPIKRETFCVQDSPLKLLPPAVQKRLVRGGGGSSSSGSSVGSGSTRVRSNTSSPASGTRMMRSRTQPKTMLRNKSDLSASGILPSKALLPATSSVTSLKTANTRTVPAENASRLAQSSKVDLRSKAPTLTRTKAVVDLRRNTSSSSFNSSLCISPTGTGKRSTSLNASISGPSSRAPAIMSRLASTCTTTTAAKTRRCTPVGRAADPPPPATAAVRDVRRSFSVQSLKMSDTTTGPSKLAARSTPVKRVEPSTPTPFQQSPAKRPSVSQQQQQQLGPRPKPMACIAPTRSTQMKGLKRSESVVPSPDKMKIIKPIRLRSAGSLDSLLQEKSATHLFHSTPSVSRIKRPSALPNPVNQSVISDIPAMTPKWLPESGPTEVFISARKTSNQSSPGFEPTASEEEPKIQPFFLEEALQKTQMHNEVPTCVKMQSLESAQEVVENREETVEPQAEFEAKMESEKEAVENQEPEPDLIELQSVEEAIPEAKTEEILLLDLPVSSFKPEDKPLIDLSNTPDLIRTVSHIDDEIQLIDLTSPLMKWSPDKKENSMNEAPLINFSF